MDRREALRRFGLTIGAATVDPAGLARLGERTYEYATPRGAGHVPPARPVTAVTLGAGNRGNVYGGFAAAYPDQLKIVGVAEPNPVRHRRYRERHAIPAEHAFPTWEHVFERPKFADAVIVSTPDALHHGPCMRALAMGYDVLLEKPIAPTERECREILAAARRTGRIVAVCHVLRYAPYFVKMRELLAAGAVGQVVSVQHFEPIEYEHMAHSYVRGNWHDSKATTPIILAKSCHDLDIIRWMLGRRSRRIAAMGDLRWFRAENAPPGSTARCTDGCAVEPTCPYSALRIYHRKRRWDRVFDLPEDKAAQPAAILERLKTTDYGRCVYRMDNDQPDHYVTSIEFEGGVTASFSMEAFTSYAGRRTRVMGAMGDMVGDMTELVVTDFRTGKQTKLVPKAEDVEGYQNSGHGGGDWLLVRDFVQAVSRQDPRLLTSTVDDSIESHVMGFMAEESRTSGRIMAIEM